MYQYYKAVDIIIFLLITGTQLSFSQQITDKDAHEKILRLNTWQVKEAGSNGFVMAVDYPYNLGNQKRQGNQYISIWAAVKPYENRPMNIAITLPNNIINHQLTIGFSNSLVGATGKLTETYWLNLAKYMANNNTREASLPNGMLNNTIDVFNKFMTYKYVYLLFSDSLGKQRLTFSLPFFRKRFIELTQPAPTYFTGNPADTAFTAEEKQDKAVFNDGSIPSPWDIASISNPVRFKHFFKYLQYLVINDKKEQIADLIEFPTYCNTPDCLTADDFIKNYDRIFDEKLKMKITQQRLGEIFRNRNGVLIGDVICIWIKETRYGVYKIVSICNRPQ